jgi:hypothetical protein
VSFCGVILKVLEEPHIPLLRPWRSTVAVGIGVVICCGVVCGGGRGFSWFPWVWVWGVVHRWGFCGAALFRFLAIVRGWVAVGGWAYGFP